MIGIYSLQVDVSHLFDGLQSFQNTPIVQQYSVVGIWIGALITLGVFGFFGLRILKNFITYAGDGDPLGEFIIDVQGEYRFKGHVSERVGMFDVEVINELKTIGDKEVKEFADNLNMWLQTEKLFAYDIKFNDREEAVSLRTDNDGILLSPVRIDDRNYSSLEKRGKRGITSLINKEHAKIVLCHNTSKKFEAMEIPDEGEKDVWFLVPIPKEPQEMGYPDEKGSKKLVLQLKIVNNLKDVTKAVLSISVLAKMHNELRIRGEEISKLYSQIEAKNKELEKAKNKMDLYRYKLQQHPLIGEKPLPRALPKKESIIWFFAGGVFALIGWNIPTTIPALSNMPDWFGAVIAMGVGGVIRYYVQKKEEDLGTTLERKAEET